MTDRLVFAHQTLGQRVLFGSGLAAVNVAAEVDRLGADTVMVITGGHDKDFAARVAHQAKATLLYDDVAPHVPLEKAEKARAAAEEHGVDLVVCVGGGSAIGLAKAIALTSRLPIIAVPTTYAGSEATNVWGITEASHKTTGVDDGVLPVSVIYDAELTLSLSVELSVASGLNALAHCVDSLWAPRADPINAAMAAEGIRALSAGLSALNTDPRDLRGREQTQYGAYLSAVAFSSAGSGLHHKICHVLGGAYDLPHAQTHATVLPYVLAFNAPAAPEAASRIATALGHSDALEGLNQLRKVLKAPVALRDYGLKETDLAEAADLILKVIPPSNPRNVTQQDLLTLLHGAWSGADL
ncbi:iron-containing alcohol dehydrogenase (plasmid) [Pseudarthrobacter chlorophenolicus A6]|uniref:Iron-containing alcohol dehydrogenase n=2 Tax=Pseudarthrobacter chlorophenolicus TaxID=85085 RepID=B8HJC7_PSECP|nr:maleylacetate reductase [Pseudarthrobacter chlorophenolicus]AAO46999.1 putative maleylacetate reductase [Pseudarthrobacter chlorophenolicus]ACL42525.1 iron-containing alcohol dehydrogenase [Pseudarthrobacter chlorophenolicus A6]SDQ10506.1 Alcohol dehydrogenase, class IV [Pseudarthrobacter chlorophenolicus]